MQKRLEPEKFTPSKREDIELAKPPEKPKPPEEEVIVPEEEKGAYQRAPKEKKEEVAEEKELVMGKADVSNLFQLPLLKTILLESARPFKLRHLKFTLLCRFYP